MAYFVDMISVKKSKRRLKDGRVVPVSEHVRKSTQSFASIETQSAALKMLSEVDSDGQPVPSRSFLRLLDRHPFLSSSSIRDGVSSLNPSARQIADTGFAHTSGGWHVASCPKRSRFGRGNGFPEDINFHVPSCCLNLKDEMRQAYKAMKNDDTVALLAQIVPFSLDKDIPSEIPKAWAGFPSDAKKIVGAEMREALNDNMALSDDIRNRFAAVSHLINEGEYGGILAQAVLTEKTPERALGKAIKEMARSNPTKDINMIRTQFNTMYQELLETIDVPAEIDDAWKPALVIRGQRALAEHSTSEEALNLLLEECEQLENEIEESVSLPEDILEEKSLFLSQHINQYKNPRLHHLGTGSRPSLRERDIERLEDGTRIMRETIGELEVALANRSLGRYQIRNAIRDTQRGYSVYNVDQGVKEETSAARQRMTRMIEPDTKQGFIMTALLASGKSDVRRQPAFVL